ncbi:hypothetical protein GQ44DRAFT_634291 [Phaeosphaeriaceae sp. PMI808]|nr:hypothetical protein GQ44DRAFT_634291 [Phaeosphaeriaceae sp. PMI808]
MRLKKRKKLRKCILLLTINPVVFILTILDVAVSLSLGLSIPGLEILTYLYNICLQPTTGQ